MSQEILSTKLSQLDHKIANLHLRINACKSFDHKELLTEIDHLTNEYAKAEKQLQDTLRQSRSQLTSILSQSYEKMQDTIKEANAKIENTDKKAINNENIAENKLLLAEYTLDFALQAADHALLVSMEAMAAQYLEEIEKGELSCMK